MSSAGVATKTITIEVLFGPMAYLELDLEVGEVWAVLPRPLRRLGTSIGPNDLWIAATALRHDHAVLTRNARGFSRVPGLSVLA